MQQEELLYQGYEFEFKDKELRHIKFHRWFEFFRKKNFVKIDYHFKDSAGVFCPTSLIMKVGNPNIQAVGNAFLSLFNDYNDGK